ncbi:hypothetical protein AXW59_06225 [Yersinia ruckeri]|nr:hypothetical protein UGYR_03885 [Yersinia ruckeri]AUQ42698.1 hypothetical protein NJ56_12770 [Yersinia ruckeri]OJC00321.1 hypothetical protein AXW59_06225 [Yersinia ruckeri]OJC02957.1 hypothetical protein AXW58_06205 [Yersinia ruckeri]OJC05509.1 hypothetical protein AXW57_06215 [Yersinia ruckeri]
MTQLKRQFIAVISYFIEYLINLIDVNSAIDAIWQIFALRFWFVCVFVRIDLKKLRIRPICLVFKTLSDM